jgi:hypothetical protein
MYRNVFYFSLLVTLSLFKTSGAQNLPGGRHKMPVKLKSSLTKSFEYSPFQIFSDSAQISWISIYNDPINGDDEADAMVQDSYGNLYVTGNCSDTGATYGWDITTIKYNADGEQQWLVSFDGPGHGDDVPYDIAVDQHGNVYITGYSQESGVSGYDFLTMKIDSSGIIAWYRLLSNPGLSNDVAFGVAVDVNGNIFSTGATFVPASSSFDLTTVRYNPEGVQQWIQRYNSPFSEEDTGNDLVLDSNDNVYITGVSQQAPGNYDAITLKYDNGGVLQWVKRYNGPGNSNDDGFRLALDENLNVIVTGQQTGAGTLFDMLTIKYDNDGNQRWISVYNGPGNSEDASNALVLDEAGNIYITGFAVGTNSTSDYATLKYTPQGSLRWVSFYTGPANGFEQAYGIALDNSDGVYVTGYSPSVITPFVHYEYATVKYDTSGQEQWVSRYAGNSTLTYEPNVATALTVDNSGNVYVTGELANEGVGEDFGTIKYVQSSIPVELTSFTASNSGNGVILQWSTETETNNSGFEIERQISNPPAPFSGWKKIGYVPGSGTTTQPNSYSFTDEDISAGTLEYRLKQIDFAGTFDYSNTIEIIISLPLQYSLSQNYPNPFNPATNISFSLKTYAKVTLIVYNVLGEEVTSLFNDDLNAGKHDIKFDASLLPSGIYFYTLDAKGKNGENFIASKKMILLK